MAALRALVVADGDFVPAGGDLEALKEIMEETEQWELEWLHLPEPEREIISRSRLSD